MLYIASFVGSFHFLYGERGGRMRPEYFDRSIDRSLGFKRVVSEVFIK